MDCDELYISYLFPPSDYVSGITVFKRIAANKHNVDVFQSNLNASSDDFKDFNKYINNRISIDLDCGYDEPESMFDAVKTSLSLIDNNYKRIYSRSWVMMNHFLALEYKFLNPGVFWSAEFSDPLILNVSNKIRDNKKMTVNDSTYIDNINKHITELNNKLGSDFDLVKKGVSIFYLCEYLTYLFADNIVFTNPNQREVMLNQFFGDVKDFVMDKSEISMHPTLDDEYYHLKESDIVMDDDFINIAYFGRDYYGQRHFESLFYSIESLNHKFKDKLRFHIFVEDTALLKKLIKPLNSRNNFIITKPLKYFEFLNATTKFDILIVNDVVTRNVWSVNPYLPSKLSDYLGSHKDIWGFYEKGSALSCFDLKYMSNINDYDDCRRQLVEILNDHGFEDKDCSFSDDYFTDRLTSLNKMVEFEFKQRLKLKRENKSLKKSNEEILSSNSWKLTKPFRKLRK